MHMQAHGMQILGPLCRRTSEDDTSVVSPPRGPAHRRRSANPQPHSTSTTPGPVSNYFPLYPGGSDTRNPNAPRQRCHEGPPVIPGGQPAVDRCGVSSVRVNPARAGNRKRNPAGNNKTASRPPQNCRQRRLRKISNTTAAASAPQHSLP